MATEEQPVEAPPAETPVEAPAETPPAETPVEPEKTPEQQAAEKAATEAKEAELKASAEKYAKEQIRLANQTMAAARRAEKAVADVKTENVTLKKENEVYGGFVQQLQKDPMAALKRLGFGSFRDFAQHVADNGGERELTDEEKLEALVDKKLAAREEPKTKAAAEAKLEASKQAVFKAIDDQKAKYPLTASKVGKRELWDAIESYYDTHGDVPDAAVFYLADKIESELRSDLGPQVSASPAAKQGTTAAAAPAASTSGKTLAGKSPSSAPAPRKFDPNEDDDARRARMRAELASEGVL